MVRVLLAINWDGVWQPPITVQQWTTATAEAGVCLTMRGATWVRTYLAEDGHRSMCEFEAPHAEAVREACRTAGVPFDAIWRVDISPDFDPDGIAAIAHPIVMEIRVNEDAAPDWDTRKATLRDRLQALGITPVRELSAPDGSRSLWLFSASHPDAVQQVQQAVGTDGKAVWRSQLLQPSPPAS
jgi:hypothetical protein